MGQLLSEPITTKDSSSIDTELYKVGSSSMQGWRVNMEDAHCHLVPMEKHPSTCYFAVFDGHGGDRVALHVKEHLHENIVSTGEFETGDMVGAIREGYLKMDMEMMENASFKLETSGSTGIIVMIRDNKLYCGNVGDSRAIASINGDVKELSSDHKPTKKAESNRIIDAGGWIDGNRVNGNLALSRAFGDFLYKNKDNPPDRQIISVYPDIETVNVTEDLEFILMACDGIWDCLRNNQVLDFVRTRIAEGKEPKQICEELMDHCLAPTARAVQYGTDNMTVILIVFLHGKPYAELVSKCAKVSQAQEEARRGLTLADILADSDDEEDPPELPPRPPGFGEDPSSSTSNESTDQPDTDNKALEEEVKENGEEKTEEKSSETKSNKSEQTPEERPEDIN
jgi:protein phosphatase 2C family protein 2/3